ncbi:MAG: aminotransferase class I/II-fold pyridoxal phosphate-dependent enzyme [Rhodobacteraceae bacterium]|nr:aminotransferase class I/II-fold pyridoxal phosphate-dependent enzyme [Paracoccaceae bacterium]
MRPETLAVHAGRRPDPATGAVSPPLHLSTTYERDPDGAFSRGYVYARGANPNRDALEECLAALEGGAAAVAFASGMAAVDAVIGALPPDRPRRILLPHDIYYGVRSLLAATPAGAGIQTAVVDMTDLGAVAAECAAAPPGLVWIETPSNPLVTVADIAAVAAIARQAGAAVAVDNTWATPLLQTPLALGADVVVHSATKYIGGHSDLMAGIAVVREDGPWLERLRAIQHHRGAVPSAFDCWLALRGAGSLPARMAMHGANAMAVARFLSGHPAVGAVHYPGLESHPGHAVARRQMRGFGGMLSFVVRGGQAAAFAAAAALKVVTRATSLGGTHSLIEHRASIEGASSVAPAGLLRMSVGLEHPDDLIADLGAALDPLA